MQRNSMSPKENVLPEELIETLTAFGVEESRELLGKTLNEIRNIIVQPRTLPTATVAMDLHKACGRLSLFGIYGPRYMSRELRAAINNDDVESIPHASRAEFLQAVESAEIELTSMIAQYAGEFETQGPTLRQTSTIPLTMWTYGGAAIGFLMVPSLLGAFTGLVAGLGAWLVQTIDKPID